MSRPKKYTSREEIKGRCFQCIIYPDSEDYDCNDVLEDIKIKSVQYAIAYHDKDQYSQVDYENYIEENNKNPDWNIGDPKKPHFHCILIFSNSKQLGLVASMIGIKQNYLQKVENKEGALQYLIHKNNPEKYQYNITDVESNIVKLEKKYFDLDNDMKASNILDEIIMRSAEGKEVTVTSMALWCVYNNCWDEFRRGQHIFTSIIAEQNRKD